MLLTHLIERRELRNISWKRHAPVACCAGSSRNRGGIRCLKQCAALDALPPAELTPQPFELTLRVAPVSLRVKRYRWRDIDNSRALSREAA
jgi:hypothetical protein